MKNFLILILTPFIVYSVNLKNGSSPILSLVGSSNINIEAGTTYTDPGANASDNEDGDLTSQIIITGSVDSNTLGVYSIIYSVTDSDGNTTSLTRFVNVIDTTKPVINLLGDSEITLSLGQLYNEQGATAIDNLDGDITSSIEISGNVNHNSAGIYLVKYDVSDSSGNQADTVYRNVYVGDWQDQEKVIAVWDFNDGSTDGIIDPYFNLSQTSLGFTKNGDQTGAPDGTVKVTDRNGFGNPYLTGLNLISQQLVNGKLNLSISFKYLDLSNNGKYQIFLKGYGPQDSYNHRIIGLILQGTENGIVVSQMVFNSGQQYGNAKNVGTLGTSAVVAGDITFGVTLDCSETSSSFWVYKPGQHNESPWGLTTASDVQNGNQTINFGPETLQALPSIEIKQLQFNLNLVGGLAIVDQIKISTGEYKNTVNTNNTSDNTSPIITLLGESVVTVEVGSNYVDAGATATDDVDGDLTASIITSSDVDISTVGTYLVTYNVSDTAGNAATEVTRTVNVVETLQTENNIMAVWDFDSDSTEISGGTATELTNTNLQWLNSGSADADANDGAITVDNVSTANSGLFATGLNVGGTGKYHFSIALNNWNITSSSGSLFHIRFKSDDNKVVASIKIEENKVNGSFDGDKTRVVGSLFNNTSSGTFKSGGHFGPESLAYSTPVNIGLTLDFDNDTYEYWTGTPNSPTDGKEFYYDYDGVSGNMPSSLAGVIIDHIQLNAVLGAGDSFTIDQIKISREENEDNEVDDVAPVITLLGEETVTIQLGSTYVDPGATASDNVDGDLTASIITTSNVDTSNGGTYTITYNVSDAAGNAASTVVRTVIVESSYSSSTSPITFDENWIVGVDGYSIYDINGGNGVSDVAIVQDPQDNGSRGNVLKVQYNDDGEDWQHVLIHLMEGQNRVSVGPNKTLFFDVYTDHSGDPNKGLYTGMIKLEGETSSLEYSFYVSGNGWETISINTAVDKNNNQVSDGEYEKIVFFTNYGDGIHKRQDLRYYDNITFTEGSGTGLYPQPTNSAPAPTFDESSVLNIFSDHYSNTINWSENELRSSWSNGGNTRVIDLSSNDKIVRQTNLNYSGTYWNAGGSNPRGPIDFSNYAYLNLDVWVPAYAGDYTLGVALLTSNEVKVDYTIDGGPAGWRTLTIPISDFANSEISSVDGIKFEPNPQGSIPIFYWDNLFAWGDSGDNTTTISVNAGVDVVICEGTGLELNIAGPTATNFVELAWSSSGDGIFDNNNQLTPIYYPGPTDLASGFVNLTLTATGFGQTVSDSMTLTFSQSHSLSLISGASTQDQSICEGDDIIPIIYSFGNGASSARVIGLPPGIGWTITENVLTISGALNEDISEPKIYSFTVETIAGDNDCTMGAITGTISINPSNECNNINSAKILLNGPVHVTSVDGLILTADDGKCYRLKIIQGSSIELVEVNCN